MVNKKNILLLLLSVVAVVTRCVIACTTEIEVDPKCSEGKENKVGGYGCPQIQKPDSCDRIDTLMYVYKIVTGDLKLYENEMHGANA